MHIQKHTNLIIIGLLSLTLSSCFLASKGHNDTKVSDIKPEEKERLDTFLGQLDLCYKREIQRVDDGISPVNNVTEVVIHNCQGYYNNIKETLYKEFGVGLGHAYVFAQNLQKNAPIIITEALFSKRKIDNKNNSKYKLLKR